MLRGFKLKFRKLFSLEACLQLIIDYHNFNGFYNYVNHSNLKLLYYSVYSLKIFWVFIKIGLISSKAINAIGKLLLLLKSFSYIILLFMYLLDDKSHRASKQRKKLKLQFSWSYLWDFKIKLKQIYMMIRSKTIIYKFSSMHW